jgi:hypothetical protein
MIIVDEVNKNVTVTNSTGTRVKVDGIEFELVDGEISLVNLPSVYDVEVLEVVEENHIPRPVVEVPVEEIIVPEEEVIVPEEEPTPDE